MLLSMKRCDSFCHSVIIARFSSSTVSMFRPSETPNSVVHGVHVGAVWRPHVGLDEVDLLFLQIVHGSNAILALIIAVMFLLLGSVATD